MGQIKHLLESLSENIWEIVPFHDLVCAVLIDHVHQIESAFSSINQGHFIVAPLIILVIKKEVVPLVYQIYKLHLSRASFDQEWERYGVVCGQWNQVCTLPIILICIFDF